MNQPFANETQVDKFRLNKGYLIVHNLLIDYLNLIQVITEAVAHRCSIAVLKDS